jgi:signal transduction histidine kinase/ligand-binding sensor domain-containing protein/DNA-binding response OmpR family regulator
MKRIILFSIILTLIPYYAFSNEYSVEKLNSTNGLSQNDINCVFQDSKGFIWIGTNDGLNRYDGYSFATYHVGDYGLSSNLIVSISEDCLSNLWLATADRGIVVYDRKLGRFSNFAKYSNFRHKDVKPVFVEGQDVWVYDKESTNLFKFVLDYQRKHVIRTKVIQELKGCSVNDIKLVGLKNQHIAIATEKGFFMYDIKTGKIKNVLGLPQHVISIAIVSPYRIVISTEKELLLYDIQDGRFKSLGTSNMYTFVAWANHQLWIITQNQVVTAQINELSGDLFNFQKVVSHPEWVPMHSMVDNTQNVWIGYLKEGLMKCGISHQIFNLYNADGFAGNNHISSFFANDNKLWIGTEGTGLYVYDENSLKPIHHLLNNNIIFGMAKSAYNGNLYCGTSDNIIQEVNPVTYQTKPFLGSHINARAVLADSCFLWEASYYNGVTRFDLSKGTSLHLGARNGITSRIARNFLKDRKGNLWIATNEGLFVIPATQIRRKSCKALRINTLSSQEENSTEPYVIPLLQDKRGYLWFGTLGHGLYVLSVKDICHTRLMMKYTVKNGLSNNTIKALEEDYNGNIWASTNKGLNKINPKNHSVKVYNVSDGLQSNEFNELSSIRLTDGRLLFGGINGFNVYQNEKYPIDTIRPKMVLTDFQLFNKSVFSDNALIDELQLGDISQPREIHLSYNQNSFTFVFAALQYVNPQQNKYMYMLKGFDDKWISAESDNRKAVYTNIPPGHYTFLVRGCNSEGLWSEKPLMVDVHIAPPIWATWYAYLIYFFLIAGLLYFVYSYFTEKKVRKYAVMYANIDKKRSQDLLETETRFFTNMSHEFRTPLTLILSTLQIIIGNREYQHGEKLSHSLSVMKYNGNVLLRLINELMNFSKKEGGKLEIHTQYGDFVPFAKECVSQFDYWAKEKNVKLQFNPLCQEIKVLFDSNLMEQIIYNLLSNAFKHTPEGGMIVFEVNETENDYSFSVNDSGEGMSDELQTHVFERFFSKVSSQSAEYASTGIGLSLTKSIVEMHGGTISFKSVEKRGTTFIVTIPKKVEKGNVTTDELNVKPVHHDHNSGVSPDDEYGNQITAGEPTNLLIVDDNEQILSILTFLFEDQYHLYKAGNGKEAWDVIMENPIDLVISDVMMPEMDGFQLCEKIKSEIATSHIPVVLLTAKASEQDQVEGYSYKADAYCSKPFSNDVLQALVESIVKNRQRIIYKYQHSLTVEPQEVTMTYSDEKFIRKMFAYINANMTEPDMSVNNLAQELGVTAAILNKKLKSLYGTTRQIFHYQHAHETCGSTSEDRTLFRLGSDL